MWSCALLLLGGGGGVGTASAEAQQVRLTPHVGALIPVGVVVEESVGGRLVRREQVGDVVLGGRVGIGVGHGLGVEVSLAVSPGHVARTDSTGVEDLKGFALLTSARVTRVTRLATDFDGVLGVGLGMVRRSGAGWAGNRLTAALVGTLGVQLEILPRSAFRAEIEGYLSRGWRPQHRPWRGDLILSFGVVL